jgi:hypothetical protein
MRMTVAVVAMSVQQKTTVGRMCQDSFSSFAVSAVGMQQGAFCATNSISGIKHHQYLQPDMDPKSTNFFSKALQNTPRPPRRRHPSTRGTQQKAAIG